MSTLTPSGGDVLVDVMRRHGITTAFGVISIHNLPLVEAVARDLTFVEVRHEAAAVNAADGFARASGGLGVAITSTGTGAGNAAGSMVEALTSGSRVLHVTGQIESTYLGQNRGVIHEFPRQAQMLAAVSKRAITVTDAKEVERDLEDAIATILAAPRGPVSVEWPTDLQYLARPDEQVPHRAEVALPPAPDPSAVAAAARLLAGARRPLVWVGGGAADAGPELQAMIERLGAGLLTSNSGRGIVPEDHHLVVGNFATTAEAGELIADADLLLSIGSHFRSNETKGYHLTLPTPHVQIDVDGAAIGRVYPAEVGIVADATAALRAIAAALDEAEAGHPDDEWVVRVRRTRDAVRANLTAYIGGYAEVCAAIRGVLPRGSVIARDITIPSSQWGNRLLDIYDRRSNLFAVGGGIGQGLAMGIGAAAARPDQPTLVIVGDGGLAVHLGELASLAGTSLPCIVMIFNDGGYGVLRNMQEANGFDRAGVDLYTPDFALLARSLALPYELVQGPGVVQDALRRAVSVGGPAVVEVDVAALSPEPGPFVPPVHVPTRKG